MALPEPNTEELALSARLAALIHREILTRGPIDFARFMELALYAPGLGYYSAGKTKFGAAGDFVTAPELGPLFAQSVARALAPVLRETRGAWLELGAGSGAFAADALVALAALGALPEQYLILETSADLRARQAATISARVPEFATRVHWLDVPPADRWRGVLFANEVVDALPVRRFVVRADGRIMAQTVEVDDRGRFVAGTADADAALRGAVHRIHEEVGTAWPRPYRSELHMQLPAWIATVMGGLERGLALFVDYGYPRREFYLPERREGTLVCHYRHRAHADPFVHVGLQDITAFVDFTALAEAGSDLGFELASYASQAQFLFAAGLPEIVAAMAAMPELERLRRMQEVKRLTLPGEMGERFKAMAFARGIDHEALGIAAIDQSHRL